MPASKHKRFVVCSCLNSSLYCSVFGYHTAVLRTNYFVPSGDYVSFIWTMCVSVYQVDCFVATGKLLGKRAIDAITASCS